jgi:hypothetical protein
MRPACAAFLAFSLVAGARPAPVAPRDPGALIAMRALQEKLAATGRAEARVALTTGGVTQHGRIAFEPPRLARLDLDDGETLTLHGDGGEWVQPRHRQVVHGGAQSAAAALTWWMAFVDPTGFHERVVRAGTWDITPPDSLGAGHARVRLDARGLPARLVITSGAGETSVAALSGWRFSRPRGRGAFVARTPAGFEDVSVP